MKQLYCGTMDKDGKEILKASLLYVYPNDICDFCDEKSECAVIKTIGRETLHVCKNCLKEIIEEF